MNGENKSLLKRKKHKKSKKKVHKAKGAGGNKNN